MDLEWICVETVDCASTMNMSHVWIAARWSGFYDELFTYLAAAGLGVFNRGEGVVCGPRSELRLGLGRNKDPSGARVPKPLPMPSTSRAPSSCSSRPPSDSLWNNTIRVLHQGAKAIRGGSEGHNAVLTTDAVHLPSTDVINECETLWSGPE